MNQILAGNFDDWRIVRSESRDLETHEFEVVSPIGLDVAHKFLGAINLLDLLFAGRKTNLLVAQLTN